MERHGPPPSSSFGAPTFSPHPQGREQSTQGGGINKPPLQNAFR